MKLLTFKKYPNKGKERDVDVCPNFVGQSGVPFMTFVDADGRYYRITPDTYEDVRELSRQASILVSNYLHDGGKKRG